MDGRLKNENRAMEIHLWSMAVIVFGFILLSSPSAASTPPDTIISNTANITYQVNTGLTFSKSSNSNQFTVLSRERLNKASITVSSMDGVNLYPGSSIVLGIEVKNDGINNLREGHVTSQKLGAMATKKADDLS